MATQAGGKGPAGSQPSLYQLRCSLPPRTQSKPSQPRAPPLQRRRLLQRPRHGCPAWGAVLLPARPVRVTQACHCAPISRGLGVRACSPGHSWTRPSLLPARAGAPWGPWAQAPTPPALPQPRVRVTGSASPQSHRLGHELMSAGTVASRSFFCCLSFKVCFNVKSWPASLLSLPGISPFPLLLPGGVKVGVTIWGDGTSPTAGKDGRALC